VAPINFLRPASNSLQSLIGRHKDKPVQDKPSSLAEFSKLYLKNNIHVTERSDTKASQLGVIDPGKKLFLPKFQSNKQPIPKFMTKPTGSGFTIPKFAVSGNTQSTPIPTSDKSDIVDLSLALKKTAISSNRTLPGLDLTFKCSDRLINEKASLENSTCSPFGKVLCRGQNKPRFKPYLSKKTARETSVVIFDFNCPSPDDKILGYLRRS